MCTFAVLAVDPAKARRFKADRFAATHRMQNLSSYLFFLYVRPFPSQKESPCKNAPRFVVQECLRRGGVRPQLAPLERPLAATLFALEDRDCVKAFAPTLNKIVLHFDTEGVVDASLMKRLKRLISKAEKASLEARKQALKSGDKNVTTTIEREERSVAMKENVDERSGQSSGNETGVGMKLRQRRILIRFCSCRTSFRWATEGERKSRRKQPEGLGTPLPH
jgi:hypothetical protein